MGDPGRADSFLSFPFRWGLSEGGEGALRHPRPTRMNSGVRTMRAVYITALKYGDSEKEAPPVGERGQSNLTEVPRYLSRSESSE